MKGVCAAAFALLAAALVGRSLALSRSHLVPVYDEVAYLDQARSLKNPAAAAACYWSGRCTEDNRHPLYAALAAPMMRGGPRDFAVLKLITLATGVLALSAAAVLGFSVAGAQGALLAAALPALSGGFALLSQRALADLLFAALYVGAIALLGSRRWVLFGLMAGLAYLAKGSAHLLLLGAFAVAAYRKDWRGLAWGLLGFFAVYGVMLRRDLMIYGAPFHNVNAKILWLDDWRQYWRFSVQPEIWAQVGPGWYLRRHGFGELLSRLMEGGAFVLDGLAEASGTGPPAALRMTGWPVLIFAVVGLREGWRQGMRDLVLATSVCGAATLAALSFGLAAGIGDVRFVTPIALSLLPWAAVGVRSLKPNARLPDWAAPAGAAVLGFIGLLAAAPGFASKPLSAFAVPPEWAQASEFLCGKGAYAVTWRSRYSTWDRCEDGRRPFPFDASEQELAAYLKAKRPALAVVDQGVDPREWALRAGPADEFGPKTFLGWPRCFHTSGKPSLLLAYCPASS